MGSKWVFKVKTDAEGSVERFKARLVARGFFQKSGVDYGVTFSPVARFESVRTVIALAVQNDLKLQQIDVTTAFLNGELKKEVYMKQPEGFVVKGQKHLVCKLKRSIYGLKQLSRCWNSVLDKPLKKLGFVQSVSDLCIYVASEGEMFIIATKVMQNKQNGELCIGQPPYGQQVLRKFNMENAKAVDTTVDASSKLVKMNEDSESTDKEHFQSAVGSLL